MPITPFLHDQNFDPVTVAAMSRAFRAACRKLRLADRNDPLNEIVANYVIDIASGVTRDPSALYALTMKRLKDGSSVKPP